MKFEKNKDLLEYLNNLIGTMEISLALADSISSVFGVSTITNKEQIESMAKKFNTSERDVYLDLLADYFEFDMSEIEDVNFFEKYIKSNFYELKEDDYFNNPYYKNIHIKNIKNEDISLLMDKYEPYEIFPIDDIEIKKEDFYQEVTKFGYFKGSFPFIALNHKNTTWMAITPNEINTMKKHIEKAHGSIIVFGLGLGYFSYMASIKKEVKSITIIDKDQRIIDLFIKHILPQFEYKDKIKVVNIDALEIIKSPLNYDFAFIDLWHSPEDGIDLFLNFKRKENLSKNCSFSYWLDVAMYAYLRRAFIQLIAEQLDTKNQNINYKNAKNSWDKLINNYYYKTKDLKIDNIEQVEELLQDESLLKMAL